MSHIDLGNPLPRDSREEYSEHAYHFVERDYLPVPENLPATPFFDVLNSRQSRREFRQFDNGLLAAFLWCSARTMSIHVDSDGRKWQHRPTPSAGACHPIDLFLFVRANPQRLALYDPLSHSLGYLEVANETLPALDAHINEVILSTDAAAILFGAQFGRTSAKYHNADSLVWRDAGALICSMTLVAEALGLNCCPLGTTAEPFLSKSLRSGAKVCGVGGVLLGMKTT